MRGVAQNLPYTPSNRTLVRNGPEIDVQLDASGLASPSAALTVVVKWPVLRPSSADGRSPLPAGNPWYRLGLGGSNRANRLTAPHQGHQTNHRKPLRYPFFPL